MLLRVVLVSSIVLLLLLSGCTSQPSQQAPSVGFRETGCLSRGLFPQDVNTTVLQNESLTVFRVYMNYYCDSSFEDRSRRENGTMLLVAVDTVPEHGACVCPRVVEWSVPPGETVRGVDLLDYTSEAVYSWRARTTTGAPEPGPVEPPRRDPKHCEADSDCVPATCCHATECMNRAYELDCSGIACTQECVPGTIDCGGYCKCQDHKCIVVPGRG